MRKTQFINKAPTGTFVIKVFLLLLLGFSLSSHAQNSDSARVNSNVIKRSIGLQTGLTFGESTFAEVGIAQNVSTLTGYHPFSSTYFISTELRLGDKLIIGPKIGIWASGGVGGIAMGGNVIYYTDFQNSSVVFRPEIGLGFAGLKLVYGYNLFFSEHHLNGIGRHNGSLAYYLKLKRLPDKISNRPSR